jgi:hypothetical protein
MNPFPPTTPSPPPHPPLFSHSDYKTRFAGPAPDLSAWDFSDLGTASSANVDQTTNGQVTPADETAASDYGQRLVAGARYGGAAPNEGSSDVEAAAGDDADAADEPSVVGTPSVRQIAARQRMEAAAAAEAASEGTTPAGEPLGDTDLALTAWLAAKPADGADEATLQAWVESLPEDAVAMEAAEDEAEDEAEAAVDADGAPFDGAVGASEFYATVAPDGSTDGLEEERVIGVPDYVMGPGERGEGGEWHREEGVFFLSRVLGSPARPPPPLLPSHRRRHRRHRQRRHQRPEEVRGPAPAGRQAQPRARRARRDRGRHPQVRPRLHPRQAQVGRRR